MSTLQKVLFFFVLPTLGTIVYPLTTFEGEAGIILIAIVILFFTGLGVLLLRGNSSALTFSIFLQGLNVIIRVMMVFPGAVSRDFRVDLPFLITMMVGIVMSTYLMLRLDNNDIRRTMRT
jgi:hypothetical protein